MQPYQEASEEIKRQQSEPGRLLRKTASTGLGLATGGALINKVAPFLSSYLPENLAIKGLSKISPKMGQFISASMGQGHPFDSIKEFIGEKIEDSKPKENAKQSKNIIEQESPELFQFVDQEIRKGTSPVQAGVAAWKDEKFKSIIKKLMAAHQSTWPDIVEGIFGSGQMALPQQGQQQPEQKQQPGQGGQAKQQLMQAMQALSQQLRQ